MKWVGRMAWVSFGLSIVGIFVTYIRGIGLPGGINGIKFFAAATDFSKLGLLKVCFCYKQLAKCFSKKLTIYRHGKLLQGMLSILAPLELDCT